MEIKIKNKDLRYCFDRVFSMPLNTDGDIVLQGYLIKGLLQILYKEQPELDTNNKNRK